MRFKWTGFEQRAKSVPSCRSCSHHTPRGLYSSTGTVRSCKHSPFNHFFHFAMLAQANGTPQTVESWTPSFCTISPKNFGPPSAFFWIIVLKPTQRQSNTKKKLLSNSITLVFLIYVTLIPSSTSSTSPAWSKHIFVVFISLDSWHVHIQPLDKTNILLWPLSFFQSRLLTNVPFFVIPSLPREPTSSDISSLQHSQWQSINLHYYQCNTQLLSFICHRVTSSKHKSTA